MDWPLLYLGHRWTATGDGPREWNCWSFFRAVQAAHYGRIVPHVDADASNIRAVIRAMRDDPARAQWERIPGEEDGCAVLMGIGRDPCHVGIWSDIDGGRVVHCARGAGVLIQSLSGMRMGFPREPEYYRWAL